MDHSTIQIIKQLAIADIARIKLYIIKSLSLILMYTLKQHNEQKGIYFSLNISKYLIFMGINFLVSIVPINSMAELVFSQN